MKNIDRYNKRNSVHRRLNSNLLPHFFSFLFIIFAILAAYSNSLDGIWALDDVVVNEPIGFEKILDVFGTRKISYLSFVINQKIDPFDPTNFRIFNITIHIFNAILVYIIVLISFRFLNFREPFSNFQIFAAFVSSIIFALHPLNINAVSYIIQRMASLATFFVLLSLIFYALACKQDKSIKKFFLFFSAFLLLILGFLAKENAVVAVPLILLYDYFFVSYNNNDAFKKRLLFVFVSALFALAVVSYFVPIHKVAFDVLKSFLEISKPLSFKAWMAKDVHWSPIEHILTEFRVVSRYLFLFIIPLPQLLVFDWWGFNVSKSLFEPLTTFISVIFVFSLIIFSIIFRKKFPFLSFGILWYFTAISLESFIAIGSDFYFEHRNYLPLSGLIFGLIAQSFFSLSEIIAKNKKKTFIFLMIVILTLGFFTFQRNLIWQNPIYFWNDNVRKTPNNVRANLALASSFLAVSDFKNAKNYYLTALKLSLDNKLPLFTEDSLYRLCFMYLMLENIEEAKTILMTFEKILPDSHKLQIVKGYLSFLNKDYNSAIMIHERVLRDSKQILKYDKATVHTLLGDALREVNQAEQAYNNYQKALNLNHSFPAAYHGLAKLNLSKGDFKSAEENLTTVLKLDPYNIMALTDMVYLILIKGESISKALPYAEKSVLLNPPFNKPYLIMGTILIASNKEKEAEVQFNKAREYKALEYQVIYHKAWAYNIKGDIEKQRVLLIELINRKDTPPHILDLAKKILKRLS